MIAMIVVLAVVALLLVWLSLSMAATEGAVGRVTRASLNNLILEIQTDAELSQFIRDKKIRRADTTPKNFMTLTLLFPSSI